jgi:hypothetical protein
MNKKATIGRPSISRTFWIQDIRVDPLAKTFHVLIPTKKGMEWVKMTEEFARDIGFINPDALLKILPNG